MKIIVAGATGFLGQRVVTECVRRDWKVLALSRTAPTRQHDLVEHVQIDLTSDNYSSSLVDKLKGCDAAVHCIGTLFDNTAYKRVKSGSVNLCESLRDPVDAYTSIASNSGNIKKLNEKTALILLDIAKQVDGLKSFVFVSTTEHLLPFPVQQLALNAEYFNSKRRVEAYLLNDDSFPFKRTIIRPGFMYSDSSVVTMPISATLALMNSFKRDILPTAVSDLLPAPPARPLHVDTVARFIVDSLSSTVDGGNGTRIFGVDDILRAH